MNDKLFLNGLQEFCKQAIKNAESGTTAESQIAKIQKSINEVLEELQLECKVNFGSGIAANEQGIAFVRQDTLGKEYVNGEKPTPTKGIYIWFCCIKEKENFCLEFGCSRKEKPDCEAFDRMKENGCFGNEEGKFRRFYSDFENNKDTILKDFLEFVEYYKSFDHGDFKYRKYLHPAPEMIAGGNSHVDRIVASVNDRPIATIRIVNKEDKTKD